MSMMSKSWAKCRSSRCVLLKWSNESWRNCLKSLNIVLMKTSSRLTVFSEDFLLMLFLIRWKIIISWALRSSSIRVPLKISVWLSIESSEDEESNHSQGRASWWGLWDLSISWCDYIYDEGKANALSSPTRGSVKVDWFIGSSCLYVRWFAIILYSFSGIFQWRISILCGSMFSTWSNDGPWSPRWDFWLSLIGLVFLWSSWAVCITELLV